MSEQYDNTIRGTFFVNDRKEKETHPDYTGKINVGGEDFYIKGWKKVAKSGLNFLSLAVQSVDEAQKPRTEQPKAATAPTNDDTPF